VTEVLKEILDLSSRVVFFGGAGVSTESGIPDFRSEKGLYSAMNKYGQSPESMLSKTFFMQNPEKFFKYYKENLIHPNAKPGAAHISLAAMEHSGKLSAVITQNGDGLHQMAGSKNVIELHGAVGRNYCMGCGLKYPVKYVLSPSQARGSIPLCQSCGDIVRPDVVMFEEPLDNAVVNAAISEIESVDTLIVGGTSLAVYPAAGLLHYFKGDNLVLINKSVTPYDAMANLVIHDSIGEVLSQVV